MECRDKHLNVATLGLPTVLHQLRDRQSPKRVGTRPGLRSAIQLKTGVTHGTQDERRCGRGVWKASGASRARNSVSGGGEILIKTEACGVCHTDLLRSTKSSTGSSMVMWRHALHFRAQAKNQSTGSLITLRTQFSHRSMKRNLAGVERWLLRRVPAGRCEDLKRSKDSAQNGSKASVAKPNGSKPSVDEIRKRAYEIFQARQGGSEIGDWQKAEASASADATKAEAARPTQPRLWPKADARQGRCLQGRWAKADAPKADDHQGRCAQGRRTKADAPRLMRPRQMRPRQMRQGRCVQRCEDTN